MNRMGLGIALVTALLAGTGTRAAEKPRPGSPEVATEAGVVRGEAGDGVESWKGIPYAADVSGPNRWQPPRRHPRWRGVRDAIGYGADCMQLPFPSDAAPLGTTPAEDCLFVNVWRPAGHGGKKLPVLFWIHGGGFVNGGSSPPTYSGTGLARRGIIVVSINYRLGRFGFLAHPGLGERGRSVEGNYGILDQIAGLDWTARNIASFGGDPGKITLMGESAGGMSVHMLMTSPLTRGRFRRAIIMSGGNGGTGRDDGARSAEASGLAFAAAQGIGGNAASAAALRALPAETVIDGLNLATLAASGETYSGPYADGRVVTDVRAAYAAGGLPPLQLMIGATSADIGGPDGFMIGGARELAALLAGGGMTVYPYCFSYVAQSLGRSGARHASDIPFFFDTQAVKYGAATTPRDRGMGETIADYVVNFVKSGDPNGAGLPAWRPLAGKEEHLMDFGLDGEAAMRSGRCAAQP